MFWGVSGSAAGCVRACHAEPLRKAFWSVSRVVSRSSGWPPELWESNFGACRCAHRSFRGSFSGHVAGTVAEWRTAAGASGKTLWCRGECRAPCHAVAGDSRSVWSRGLSCGRWSFGETALGCRRQRRAQVTHCPEPDLAAYILFAQEAYPVKSQGLHT